MNRNQLHVLNAGGQLPPPLAAQVQQVAQSALERLSAQLELDALDVVVYHSPWVIPETGMVGNAPDGYSVHLAIHPENPAFQSGWRTELPATLAHELHHAKRWRGPQPDAGLHSLLHALVFEGLALHFETQERGKPPVYAQTSMRAADLEALWARAQTKVHGPYDYQAWFMGSEAASLPRWGGYALGYELIRRFTAQQGGNAVTHAQTPAYDFAQAWQVELV